MRSSVLLRPPPAWSTSFAVALAAYGMLVGFAGSFTGLGGGFILVPFLLFLRLPLYQAVGTSFVAVLAISLTALSKHAAHGMIVFEVGLALGLGGIIGSQIGARLVKRVSRRRFHKLFSVVLLGLAGYLGTDAVLEATGDRPLSPPAPQVQQPPGDDGMTQAHMETEPAEEEAAALDAAAPTQAEAEPPSLSPISVNVGVILGLAGIGLLVGIAAAFAGMGGGFLLVPMLLVLGFGVIAAVATAFVAILMIAVSSLVAHIRQKGVLWRHGLVLAGAGVLGAYIGAALLHDVPSELFKLIFAALLAVFGLRMAWEGWRPSRRRRDPSASSEEEPSDLSEIFTKSTELPIDNDEDDELEDDGVGGSAPANP